MRGKGDATVSVLSGISLFRQQSAGVFATTRVLELAGRFISLRKLGSNKNDGCTAPGVAAEPK